MPRRRPVVLLALCTAASAFQVAPRPRRLTARHSLPEFLLAAGDSATVVESVGPEVYGKIFGGGVGLFVVGVGGAAITALLIDSTDAYERLAEDFGAEGMKGLGEEFGADAARAKAQPVCANGCRAIPVSGSTNSVEPSRHSYRLSARRCAALGLGATPLALAAAAYARYACAAATCRGDSASSQILPAARRAVHSSSASAAT